ncbi:vWA domain-containing protein [Oceanobacillus polygoni]|uniref:Nitric oxide reductase activation protein n=1 Tax=Oceanobacillus polygoni TaxID=1235259 RepID=A0A9X1CD87_9BACI|nr:VWA domain-containing protein [Oceanobacillus polygoni]MBP2075925.1 nitric oxide reductase activation protein [Oceanobacillus polygoni]
MNRFHDSKVDTKLFMQLQDLATVLSGNPNLDFEYSYGSHIDLIDERVTVSQIWRKLDQDTKEAGFKSDVLLRTIGTLHYSDIPTMQAYMESIQESDLPKFATQLFALLEDIRLEEIVKKSRPGTVAMFQKRRNYLRNYFDMQLAANVTRSFALDELFCLIYLLIQADNPDPNFPRANEEQLTHLEQLKPLLYAVYEATSTDETARICEQIVFRLNRDYKDSINEYFIFPIGHLETYTKNTLFDELTRTDELVNDEEDEVNKEKSEYFDETFSTWHRENKNEDRKQNFLQFELEQGSKTSMLGGGARETEDADQAMASIQGTSGESKQEDYSKMEAVDKQEAKDQKQGSESSYGEENADAVKLIKEAHAPSLEDEELYREYVAEIDLFHRKLANTIKKTIEHKKTTPRKDLLAGRLSRNLLPLVLDDTSRVFYKKDEESKEFDAVFTLLIDCSASMVGKMEETKKGIVLFHEVLKQLQIPHAIIGFWEDANEVKEGYQPNYFHMIHTHTDSFYQNNGPKIMQLEPEEDNRDGFSIRVALKDLEARREKNKFLLVFSDGEPAAAGYDQNGIVDTHLAVSEARKKGIDVIGMFLSDGEIGEREDVTMENIYGRERVMVPSVAELPEHFAPLLKKLLLKAI